MSEPWALFWSSGAPMLITFQHRPSSISSGTFAFPGALGSVRVMPLYGLQRGAWPFDDAVVQARALVQKLAAFPVALHEAYAVNEAAQTVAVTDSYDYETLPDDWGTQATPIAPLPPTVWLAGKNGYPVHFSAGATETSIATWLPREKIAAPPA